MIVKKFLDSFGLIYFNLKNYINKIYQNSNLYDKKISKTYSITFNYKPSPHLLSSLIKYQKKKYKIEDFSLESIWTNNINSKDYKKLNNFFWFFSLDLKSSKKAVQSLIVNWINNNNRYNNKSWDFDLTSKRVISWLSNHELTYDDDDKEFKIRFNSSIQKQTNHLLNEIKNSKVFENKMIGCAAIILTGLAYQNNKIYLDNGLSFLRKIVKTSIDNNGFPKSRNIKQLSFYLKYFILIREWFKESQNTIPEFIDETIYYLGINYASVWQNIKHDILFNGNYLSNNDEFDQYLKRFNYTFKNENKETAGYAILKNKKIILAMDVGPSPIGPQSNDYQSGALSFEIISSGKKLISNSGYFANKQNKLNKLSKSTALHSTLVIEDYSSCSFKKLKSLGYLVDQGLKIMNKNIVFEDNYWKISASHDGYLKKFGSIHNREIEFYPEQTKFVGTDKIVRKNKDKNVKFDIRFHLDPDSKVMKTQDNKSILIELENEGWKFSCDKFNINIDNGLYFGNKNSYKENHNIFISGITRETEQVIKWEIKRL
jgi:uncharacterized heparinase superfamily protein